mmetsp:Transcript_16508/g.28298  ORF Transcript_16508/g.28298 Transcript_16508/m.28298 type:complete len:209 (-) Transcript_16508:339-965(-)|eukprot:CAMPEP_0119101278 /NCGR_PEP_ID=MMETSP1180-20130426/375_1 /TAXON_ID=3052 ORGANISM="Chlamydomonas cf sp, Strain CCMP681" /NCGR_SAMPLE_ID=MMETSP1180 /ASSEMBLY_ACC=CAM_ASM_000741 /LENGTH=208 /DNA_ID=CAMNT_0007085381 /DNA_START=16 /DNA_END=642 /DNA_ORIENTATION=+
MALNMRSTHGSSRSVAGRSSCSPRVVPFSRPGRLSATRVLADAAAPVAEPVKLGTEKTGPAFKALKDINQIMQTLPHRYPFLLVDRVVEWEREKYAVGYKCVTVNDNFFPGHFPERPIMPGVLQVEAMAQLAGLCMLDPEDKAAKGLFFFGGIENCRFRKPVVPGDMLMMRAEITKYNKRFGVVKVAATGYVGTELVVEAELTLAMAK